ncbi:hypothetical protein ACH9EU_11670 [Kocuria sp. M1R5S2]|uniref:hypothetical protein n=1 Tax=Kocuria rhizosphaerae TaxID=3376285 RepID=UPI00379821C6
MMARALGLSVGVAIVALGLWLIWRLGWELPVGLFLAGLGILVLRPILDWLKWKVSTREDDEDR